MFWQHLQLQIAPSFLWAWLKSCLLVPPARGGKVWEQLLLSLSSLLSCEITSILNVLCFLTDAFRGGGFCTFYALQQELNTFCLPSITVGVTGISLLLYNFLFIGAGVVSPFSGAGFGAQ